MEKGILPVVFCSSLVAALATAFVCSLAKSSIFIRCCLSSRVASASTSSAVRENIIQHFNCQRRHISCHEVGVDPSQPLSYPTQHKKNCRGITLIEVLVTLVVLSVGLLGLAAMQVRAMQMNQGAYMRSQAVSLSQDMADRMRINWEAAEGGSYEITLAAKSDDFKADDSDADQLKLAMQDISDWLVFIKTSLPEGDGSVSQNGDRFTITLCWDDSRGQGTQLSELACGANGMESNEIEVTL